MKKHCAASCVRKENKGNDEECKDHHPRCKVFADLGECQSNAGPMRQWCAESCGVCNGEETTATDQVAAEESDDDECQDFDDLCPAWARQEECLKNPVYMKTHCPKSCEICVSVGTSTKARKKSVMSLTDEGIELAETAKYGVLQKADGTQKLKTLERIRESLIYMKGEQVVSLPKNILESCQVSVIAVTLVYSWVYVNSQFSHWPL